MSPALEATARQWLVDEVHERAQEPDAPPGFGPANLQLSPVSWVLPKLLRIVAENSQQPVACLAPLIRTMLAEQVFATTGGDPAEDDDNLDHSIDETVAIVVRVLERIRQQKLANA